MHGNEVVVVGGGFTGMAVAASLAGLGARVTVLESHQGFDPRFRGELIHPRGVRALESLGLKSVLEAAGGVGVRGFAVQPGEGQPLMKLPYGVGSGTGLGIDHQAMVGALRKAVAARPNVTLLQGRRVEQLLLEDGTVCGVRTHDGHVHRAQLVIGADGRQSKVRKLLGLEPEVKLLSYSVAVSVEGDLLAEPGYGHVFLGAPGPILAYPFGHHRVRMVIDVPLGEAKGKDGLKRYVRNEYARFVPEPLRSAMLQSLDAHPLEGCANHSINTEACAVPGAVLVGDSGGCSHPLTATGMTSAMNDVLVLTEELASKGLTVEALREYQKRRYRFVRARELFTDALYEVFRADDEGAQAMREGVFKYWASGERARTKSMGILCGEESSPAVFASEYVRVMGRSSYDVARAALRLESVFGATKQLGRLWNVSLSRLEHTATRVAKTVIEERRSQLRLPAEPARGESVERAA